MAISVCVPNDPSTKTRNIINRTSDAIRMVQSIVQCGCVESGNTRGYNVCYPYRSLIITYYITIIFVLLSNCYTYLQLICYSSRISTLAFLFQLVEQFLIIVFLGYGTFNLGIANNGKIVERQCLFYLENSLCSIKCLYYSIFHTRQILFYFYFPNQYISLML